MRGFQAAFVLVFLVASAAVPGAAQSPAPNEPPADNTVTISDPEKDVVLSALSRVGVPNQNGSCPAPSQCHENFDHIDITKIVFGGETQSDFRVTMHLKALTSVNTVGNYRRYVTFSYGAMWWRLNYGACGGGQQQTTTGCLQSGDGGFGGFRTTRTLQTEQKGDDKSITFIVPKGDVYNQDRVPVRYADMLVNISAYASHSLVQGFGPGSDLLGSVAAFDVAPQIGYGPAFIFNKGSKSAGSLALHSTDPIRVSNGEATTIVYKVTLQNKAAKVQTVQLQAQNIPKEWSVRVPALLTLQPNTNVSVPVIASIPFTHDHGKTVTFNVIAKAGTDQAQIDLGIFWTDVPQPSAHHQGKQWFHSAPSDNPQVPSQVEPLIPQMRYWMNGIEKDPDPQAQDHNVPAQYQTLPGGGFGGGGPGTQFQASWFFPLAPPLLIGLDFDLAKTSRFAFELIPKVPSTQATVTSRLHYCDPQPQQPQQGGGGGGGGGQFGNAANCNQGRPTIAVGAASQSLNAGSPNKFEIQMVTDPRYDLLPYKHGANLGISVTMVANTPQNAFGTEPRPEFITKNAILELALFEYHDPVEQAFQSVGSLNLVPLGETEKLANPGKTSVFHFELESGSTENQSQISLEIQGVNRQWAKILGRTELELEPSEKRNITVSVTVPDDAVDDERADLFLRAENLEDPSIVTAVRFRTTVTSTEEIADELNLATAPPDKSNTPGPAFIVAVAAALVGLLLRRRR